MTRTRTNDCMEPPIELDVTMGETLSEAVWQASDQGRLTFGVHECARLLEINPFNTMLCVLPESPAGLSDVSIRIKHMLIEAFCTEYDIRVIKVDSEEKLAKVAAGRVDTVDNAGLTKRSLKTASPAAMDCLLVQYPDNDPSKEDELIAEFHKSCLFTEDNLHSCFIPLPD